MMLKIDCIASWSGGAIQHNTVCMLGGFSAGILLDGTQRILLDIVRKLCNDSTCVVDQLCIHPRTCRGFILQL